MEVVEDAAAQVDLTVGCDDNGHLLNVVFFFGVTRPEIFEYVSRLPSTRVLLEDAARLCTLEPQLGLLELLEGLLR